MIIVRMTVLLAILAVCAGCRQNAKRDPAASRPPDAAPPPQRVVCGSPAVTEIVYALNCGDRVVGVSDYCTYPPEACEVTGIGGWINPSRERLLMLTPDLIISQGRHDSLASFAREYDIAFHRVALDDLADVYEAIRSIADALGVDPAGARLNAKIRDGLDAVAARVADAAPRRVLLVFGRVPGSLAGLATVGPGTFLDELITRTGGRNIFADATGSYPQVSKEALLIRQPEVILEVNPDMTEDQVDQLRKDWNELPDLPAVENGRIVYLNADYILVPGPRLAKTAALLAEAIAGEMIQP